MERLQKRCLDQDGICLRDLEGTLVLGLTLRDLGGTLLHEVHCYHFRTDHDLI